MHSEYAFVLLFYRLLVNYFEPFRVSSHLQYIIHEFNKLLAAKGECLHHRNCDEDKKLVIAGEDSVDREEGKDIE
jgi:hypothetical protein